MEKNFTYPQLQVWRSAQNVSQKIYNLTNYFPEEEVHDMADTIRHNAKTLAAQVSPEYVAKDQTGLQSSMDLIQLLQEELIYAFDQGCITERELKTTLEAINIYAAQLEKYRGSANVDSKHLLLNHLSKKSESSLS